MGTSRRTTAPAPWRFRRIGLTPTPGPWWTAQTLTEVRDVVGDSAAQVQKRTGRAREGYVYRDHSTIPAHEYDVEGLYDGGWERVTTETSKAEAEARRDEYREHEPTAFRIRRVRSTT